MREFISLFVGLRKRREFALVEPEDLPFTKRMKEVLWADDSPNE